MIIPVNLKIEANSELEAQKIAKAMMDIKDAAIKEIGLNRFLAFADKIKNNPSKISSAAFFMKI